MIIYGFRALYPQLKDKTFEDYNRLVKSDYDLLMTEKEFDIFYKKIEDLATYCLPKTTKSYMIKANNCKYDITIIDKKEFNSNGMLYNQTEYHSSFIVEDGINEFKAINIKTLYELKKSHRMISKFFDKTMKDFKRLDLIYKNKEESKFYKLRLKETIKRADKQTAHINLKKNGNDFFDPKLIDYIYDHDSIHESIKLTSKPIYKKMLKNDGLVSVSEELWNNLSFEHKKFAVLEESYVLAIERALSKGYNTKPKKAFEIALEKVCTTITKGWFRKFSYENYEEIKSMYKENFWIKFQKDLKLGLIKEFKDDNNKL